MELQALLALGLAAALLLAAAVVAELGERRRQARTLLAAMTERDRAHLAEGAALRALRLAAIELRTPATTLLGRASQLCADGGCEQTAAAIGAIAHQLLDLADDLQHRALADAAHRGLREEPVSLDAMLRDAIAVVQASLEPSQRQWRLPVEVGSITLLADRRALTQILKRVLGAAARFSRHDDWIEITVHLTGDGCSVIVADEGNGAAATDSVGGTRPGDSRGLGLGLALARVLMEAHGGALQVEAVPSVGTRVTLDFPATRVLGSPPIAPVPLGTPVGAV
jgi:signal transduction histidine kinase